MLNQLVESRSNQQETARKSGFLLMTLCSLVTLLLAGWVYSLFAKDFEMGGSEMELSRLVAPVAVNDEPPPPVPEPENKPEKAQTNASDKVILKDLYEDLDKNPPKDTRGEKDIISARKFNLKDVQIGPVNQIPGNTRRTDNDDPGCGLCNQDNENTKEDEKTSDLVVKPKPKPSPEKIRSIPSGGVMNGKATNLVKPPYPPTARLVKASGAVNVQVTIDERGNVISASAVSGHPLLRSVSERAALSSKFTPTLLSNQPVKVTGIIIYKFTP